MDQTCWDDPTEECTDDALKNACADLYKPCCIPECGDKHCGDDGCWGSCGECTAFPNLFCADSGMCFCAPDCEGKVCTDNGCGVPCSTCEDSDPCTVGVCVGDLCHQFVLPECCAVDADCDLGNECTSDHCTESNTCVHEALDELPCCQSWSVCGEWGSWDPGTPGTVAWCYDYHCIFMDGPDYCDPDLPDVYSCEDDGEACTADICSWNGKCEYKWDPGCCHDDVDCDDGNLCTTGVCFDMSCSHLPIPGCCKSSWDCDDGIWCTEDYCGSDHQCHNSTYSCDCWGDVSCDDGNECTIDDCDWLTGICTHELNPDHDPPCCWSSSSCFDGDPCTWDNCINYTCDNSPIEGCCMNEGDIDPICDDGLACTCDVCIFGTCRHLGPGQAPSWCEFSGQACCESDLDCDDFDEATLDFCWDLACTTVPATCESDQQCDDGNACTTDSCADSLCQFTVSNPGCCGLSSLCNDGNPCTLDVCSSVTNACTYFPLAVVEDGCCSQSNHCGDGVPCTTDKCVDYQCQNTVKPDACFADADCGDGSVCTVDECIDCACQNTPIPECCQVDYQCDDGNPCTADDCVYFQQCEHNPVPACCLRHSDCGNGNPCTNDICFEHECLHQPNDGAGCDDGDPDTLNDVCVGDECVCALGCVECGDDGCGGSCGVCGVGATCVAGICCEPDCAGKECGSNGCGGSCGGCATGQGCVNGSCLPPGVECVDGNAVPWDGCTDGSISEFIVNFPSVAERFELAVATRPDGDLVVVWQTEGQWGMLALQGRLFDFESEQWGAEFEGQDLGDNLDIAALDDGSFVLVGADSHIHTQRRSSAGLFLGWCPLQQSWSAFESRASVAHLTNNRYVVAHTTKAFLGVSPCGRGFFRHTATTYDADHVVVYGGFSSEIENEGSVFGEVAVNDVRWTSRALLWQGTPRAPCPTIRCFWSGEWTSCSRAWSSRLSPSYCRLTFTALPLCVPKSFGTRPVIRISLRIQPVAGLADGA